MRVKEKIISNNKDFRKNTPIVRLRDIIAGIFIVFIFISWPLFMVFKQALITNLSLKESYLNDSIYVLNKKYAELKIYNEKLVSNSRIETIAKNSLQLDYPSPDQIVIIKEYQNKKNKGDLNIFATVKKQFSRFGG